jgi:hypothetical protein
VSQRSLADVITCAMMIERIVTISRHQLPPARKYFLYTLADTRPDEENKFILMYIGLGSQRSGIPLVPAAIAVVSTHSIPKED